jgi:hypothetical protein
VTIWNVHLRISKKGKNREKARREKENERRKWRNKAQLFKPNISTKRKALSPHAVLCHASGVSSVTSC